MARQPSSHVTGQVGRQAARQRDGSNALLLGSYFSLSLSLSLGPMRRAANTCCLAGGAGTERPAPKAS